MQLRKAQLSHWSDKKTILLEEVNWGGCLGQQRFSKMRWRGRRRNKEESLLSVFLIKLTVGKRKHFLNLRRGRQFDGCHSDINSVGIVSFQPFQTLDRDDEGEFGRTNSSLGTDPNQQNTKGNLDPFRNCPCSNRNRQPWCVQESG